MGAPGVAFLCEKGHLFSWLDDGLYWGGFGVDENGNFIDVSSGLSEECQEIEKEGCPCGATTLAVINHYGDINDCLGPEEKLTQIGVEKLRFRIKGAMDAWGRPLEAFIEREVPVYDVSPLKKNKEVDW